MFKRKYIVFSMLLLVPLFINVVYADEGFSISDIPKKVADHLCIPFFASQLLCSALVFLMLELPIVIMVRGKNASWIPEVAGTFIILGLLVGMEWLPIWFLLIIALITMLLYSDKLKHKEEASY